MTTHTPGAATWLAGIAIVSVAAVGAALVSQHVFGMLPCPWCVLQRLIFLAIALACVIGLLWRSAPGRIVSAGLSLVFALSGVAAATWHYFWAASAASCNLTLADKIVSRWLQLDILLPSVFEPRASCADAAVTLFGLPYPWWSLGLFVLAALAAWQVLRSQWRE